MSNLTEKDLIGRIAEKYKSDGFEVIIRPGKEYIPFDLGNYRPDLIAKKGTLGTYIVEVKKHKSDLSIDQLKEIASSTDAHEGWHFVLVTGDDVRGETEKISQESVFSWGQIISEKEKAVRYLKLNEYEISFFIFWRILDAMMRNYANEEYIPIDRLPTYSLINHLYSQGELSIEEFDKLNRMRKFRNQLAHGLQTEIKKRDVEELQQLINDLLKEWHSN
ncbi:MAG: DUF4145 domain-containing protein [Candidatus Hodarchaeales archaeon]